MAASLRSGSLHWRALCGFTICWLALTFVSFTASLQHLLEFAIIGSILGVSLAAYAIVRGEWKPASVSLVIGGLMFFALVVDQVVSGAARENIPILLLQFVMFLFAVEVLTGVLKQETFVARSAKPDHAVSDHVLQRSSKEVQARIARLGVFFASCYVITLGLLYIGAQLRAVSPVLTDVSFYVVVVSISLALLILVREE